jgi:hypothetical protein
MKKSILILGLTALMSGGQFMFAQVGINTESPTNTLHIVGDTATVHGQAFRLVDGNQGDGKLLVSDADGVGTWGSTVPLTLIYGITKQGTMRILPFESSRTAANVYNFILTDAYIDLPPGLWKVDVAMLLTMMRVSPTSTFPTAEDVIWIRSTFTDDPAVLTFTADINTSLFSNLASGKISGPLIENYAGDSEANMCSYDMLFGTIAINNSTEHVKRYWYLIGGTSASSASDQFYVRMLAPSNSENTIIALPLQAPEVVR